MRTGLASGRWPGCRAALTLASYLTAEPAAAAQYRLIVDVLLDEQERILAGVSRPGLDVLLRDRLATGRVAGQPFRWTAAWASSWTGAWPISGPVPAACRTISSPRPRPGCTAPSARWLRTAATPVPTRAQDPGGSVAASVAPPVLAGHLGRLAAAVPGQPGDAAQAWSVVRTTFGAMAEAAAGWQARLAAALAGAADPARVAALQDTLRRYVDVWGTGVDRHSGPIAGHAAACWTRARPPGGPPPCTAWARPPPKTSCPPCSATTGPR